MLDWSQDYNVEWRLMHVNKDTWADAGMADYVKSVHIDTDATNAVPMLAAASLELEIPIDESWQDGWYRFEGVFQQGTYRAVLPIGTFLVESGSDDVDFGVTVSSVDGYSVLKPAADRKMLVGSYVPKGVNGAEYAAGLLRECVLAPVVVEGRFVLNDYMAYGADTSYLEVVWDIIDAGSFCMSLDGDGTIHVKPKPDTSALVLNNSARCLLMPKITRNIDKTGIPNVYRAIAGDGGWAEAVNDNPESSVSTVSRGRRVEVVDTNPQRINGETLKAYAERKLEEESTLYKSYSYTREYDPEIGPFDMVTATLPNFGFDGDLRVLSQSIDCGAAITVTETASMVIKEYEAR